MKNKFLIVGILLVLLLSGCQSKYNKTNISTSETKEDNEILDTIADKNQKILENSINKNQDTEKIEKESVISESSEEKIKDNFEEFIEPNPLHDYYIDEENHVLLQIYNEDDKDYINFVAIGGLFSQEIKVTDNKLILGNEEIEYKILPKGQLQLSIYGYLIGKDEELTTITLVAVNEEIFNDYLDNYQNYLIEDMIKLYNEENNTDLKYEDYLKYLEENKGEEE